MQETTLTNTRARPFYKEADWLLLIFLALFTNQSNFSIKLVGLAFIFALRPNFKLGLFKGRIPPFYPLIIIVSLISLIIRAYDVPPNYLAAFGTAIFYWVASMLGFHQMRLSVERNTFTKTHNTLKAFTVLNLLYCAYQLLRIQLRTHTLNPFRYLDFPYGMSTGDRMFGFFMENSYFNMIVSSFMVVYFLYRRNFGFSLIAMLTLTIVFGNTGNFFFILVLSAIWMIALIHLLLRKAAPGSFSSESSLPARLSPGRHALWYVPLLMVWSVVIYLIVSPENFTYLIERTPLKKTAVASLPMPTRHIAEKADTSDAIDINTTIAMLNFRQYSHPGARDTADYAMRKKLTRYAVLHMQGKKLSMMEAYYYMKASPMNMLLGAGPTRFSSYSAHRVSGMDSSRIFLKYLPHYVSREYAQNHMLLAKYRLAAKEEYYSNANWPDNFYNQIFGEYGLVGGLLFAFFYIGYFLRRHRKLSWGWWITPMVCVYGILCYLFDTLCIMVFYELLMLHDIKRREEREKDARIA